MSDAAQSERRAAALESSAPSNAMKPATRKTWQGWRANVWGCHPAAGMKGPDARKTWRGRRANVWGSHPAAGMKGPPARKTWRGRRADVDSCGPAKPMQTAAANKAWRDRRADVRNSGAVKLMKIAAAKAAVESAAGKPAGDRRSAGVDTGRRMNAGCAKLTKPWTTAKGRSDHTAAQIGGRDASAWAPGRRAGIDGV
jgi:hypothetical protein